jgi:hypothetical protein
MTTSEFETEAVRPVEAHCDQNFLFVTLADGAVPPSVAAE